jgi:hypothetical protein
MSTRELECAASDFAFAWAALVPALRGATGPAEKKRDGGRAVSIGQIAFGPPQSGPDLQDIKLAAIRQQVCRTFCGRLAL